MPRVHERVSCTIEYVARENHFPGCVVPSVLATCSRCCHQTQSNGWSILSVRECLSLMRRDCPSGGRNDYETAEASSSASDGSTDGDAFHQTATDGLVSSCSPGSSFNTVPSELARNHDLQSSQVASKRSGRFGSG